MTSERFLPSSLSSFFALASPLLSSCSGEILHLIFNDFSCIHNI
jgi:hypothetical protein